ncbi:MAG: SUMF1/EgtB/PvdO family nonheme iron enzyme [Deltaproteobacteria bacterium]|nr:SUMF1/EgtB/PvdO family nonheme iron enzyme [Deltaproteobacteria bacterium]
MRNVISKCTVAVVTAGLGSVALAGCAPDIPGPEAFAAPDHGGGAGGKADVQVGGGGDAGLQPCTNAASCPAPTAACTVAVCKNGACDTQPAADGAACSDGIDCTIGDTCKAGKCSYATSTCVCLQDGDCASKEDGDLCNGTKFCDPVAHNCIVNPATIVVCKTVDDTQCLQTQCVKATGMCELKPVANKTPCDDNDQCTVSEVCLDGQCTPSVLKCTCKTSADCKDDGDLCNGKPYCNLVQGKCLPIPGTEITCDKSGDTACLKNTCDKTTGTCAPKSVAEGIACATGDVCQGSSTCKAGQCIGGTNLCPCASSADCAKFDDGNLCNGVLYCDKTTKKCAVNPTSVPAPCSTTGNGPCVANTCDPKTGQCAAVTAANNAPCSDGDPCSAGDFCSAGKCVAGPATCDCATDAECAKYDDADLCNGKLTCEPTQKVCKLDPATVPPACPAPSTACQVSACDPKSGKCTTGKLPDGSACSDGNACTAPDQCAAGVCKAGANVCACQTDGDCLDDGNLCNGVPYCDKSGGSPTCKSKPGSEVKCAASGKVCVVKSCEPLTGQCVDKPGTCTDNNPCTLDSCDVSNSQCKVTNTADGTACESGKVCAAGKCVTASDTMVLVPSGKTWVGCAPTETGCAAPEQPQHLVSLPAFFLDRFEVTVAHYKQCLEANACTVPANAPATCNLGNSQRAKHPINCLPWSAASAYCAWVGKRLPTEAEWEMAARGHCVSADSNACKVELKPFPWGTKLASCSMTWMKDAVKGGDGCNTNATTLVGLASNDVSPVGVRDLGGNVSEWVQDTYEAGFYAKSPQDSPVNAAAGTQKVARGGNFASIASETRSARRQGLDGGGTYPSVGFRCAKDVK